MHYSGADQMILKPNVFISHSTDGIASKLKNPIYYEEMGMKLKALRSERN